MNKEIVNKLLQEFQCNFIGLTDNSFEELCYSLTHLKRLFRWKYKAVVYIPFIYKEKIMWYKDLNYIKKLPFS